MIQFILSIFFVLTFLSAPVAYADHHGANEKPVKHIEVAEIQNMAEAENVFLEETAKLKAKKKLDITELQEIHIITYTLEQSVAFLVENLNGEHQILANEIAAVVENIHLESENNRADAAKSHLDRFFKLADKIAEGF